MGLAALSATVLVPTTASGQEAVDLTLVHGLPGVTADVSVDGTVVIDDFAPGSMANITSFAGQTLVNLTVTDSSTDEVIIGPIPSTDMPGSGSHTLVAHLDASGTAVLNSYQNNTDAVSSGEARLTLRHTAEAPPIELIIGTDRPVQVSNGESAEVELPAGTLEAQIGPVGDTPIASLPTLDLAANTNTVVHVIGSLPDNTIDFVVQIVEITPAAGATTTTDPNATTTTTDPNATTTTSTSTTSTTSTSVAAPSAVNTGSPLDDNSSFMLVAVALGGLALAGGAMFARRRV
jgi:hypothetical protein